MEYRTDAYRTISHRHVPTLRNVSFIVIIVFVPSMLSKQNGIHHYYGCHSAECSLAIV